MRSSPSGWGIFAALVLIVAGIMNVVAGATAIDQGNTISGQFLFSDLDTWGWIVLLAGCAQALAGILVLMGHATGNYIGVVIALIAVTIWAFFLFTNPVAAMVAVVMNLLVVYGLTVGSEEMLEQSRR